MPNCDWYGTLKDHENVLNAIFENKDFEVYESYSQLEQPLKKFGSVEEVQNEFNSATNNGSHRESLQLALFIKDSGPRFVSRKILLNPNNCEGAEFRFAADGWGLLNFRICDYIDKKLESSHTNHNSRLRAEKWSQLHPELGSPSDWDFDKIKVHSSRLNRKIKSYRVAKLGARAVLPEAYELWKSGICLDAYNPAVHAEFLSVT